MISRILKSDFLHWSVILALCLITAYYLQINRRPTTSYFITAYCFFAAGYHYGKHHYNRP